MPFRSWDSLRLFTVVARHLSFATAGSELNLSKGAISYRIKRLERDLGFPVLVRGPRGIGLTEKGEALRRAANQAFGDLDREIGSLRDSDPAHIVIGLTTYFASRWLSPRLMTFIVDHPDIALRLQPMIDLVDLPSHHIDMAVRWGTGHWSDLEIEPLLACPAYPTAGPAIAARLAERGLAAALAGLPHLHDRDGSTAWRDWYRAAGLLYREGRSDLVIPDPNVRVQAVIDGQGIALNDRLVAEEQAAGRLARISSIELTRTGYFLAYPAGALERRELRAFRNWILGEAASDRGQPATGDELVDAEPMT